MDVIHKLDGILSERNKMIRLLKGETPKEQKKEKKEAKEMTREKSVVLTREQQERLDKLLAIKGDDNLWNLSEEIAQRMAWIDKYEFSQDSLNPVHPVDIPKNVKNPFSFGKSLLSDIDDKLSKLDH